MSTSDSRLTAELAERYLATGQWTPRALSDPLRDAVAEHPDRIAAVSVGSDGPEATTALTYAELDHLARRIAAGLSDLGIGPGDGVAIVLPNCVEFAGCIFGVLQLGAVYTGIPVAYGERETEAILRRSHARVAIVPAGFRGVQHLEMLRRLRPGLADLEHIVVLAGEDLGPSEATFDSLLDHGASSPPAVDPGAVAHVGFTSGTTGEPKGVMNSHQTLEAVMRGFVEHVGAPTLGHPLVNLVASPVGHHTGFLWGVLLTARMQGTAVYLERWSSANAAAVIAEHGVTTLFGAPTFLQDLLQQRSYHGRLPSLSTIVVAGAPVPEGLPDDAREAFDCWVCPAWGMTEWGIGISRAPHLDARGEGRPLAACEIAIVDEQGTAVGPDVAGRLLMRGPGLFLGYKERPDAMQEAFGADGFFDTGDLAAIDGDGYVSLRGRTKDIIIRGGENIPVTDVESLLVAHPDVVEAAVVGVPDERLGERAAAVIVVRGAAQLDVASVSDHLLAHGLSKHYLPEFVIAVTKLPKTASGKIRKSELRSRLAARSSAQAAGSGPCEMPP
jgi:cyclohexanecarboxylate-CoA ligase